MNIISFTPEHYEEISCWWRDQNWTPVDLKTLPTNGLIIPGVCAGFLYMTDSNLCLLEWVIANPKTDKEIRSEGLDLLIDSLLKKAEELKYSLVFTSVSHPRLMDRYTKLGFQKTDTDMCNFIKVI
jgi:hypothetical protein